MLDEQVGLDSDWTQREISLADYRGESVQLRWRLVTAPERDTTADGYSLDDVAIGH